MASSKRPIVLAEDAPWRKNPSGSKPIPKIHQNPLIRVQQSPASDYGLAVMRHANPIGGGLAFDAKLEPAGPDCVIPGQVAPVRILGLKVWPVNVDLKFMEPVQRELQTMGKFLDSAVNLMNASFQDR
ncbi:hypothetical protein QJS04_geneDACA009511 [Acorus gramineus]|uniref:PilZ domain-containing protein n=1 Tax=Acorus gramineus TaxID=55184 RepID=A0AAV9AHP1_ACOGR|nr:hypothetical protein QJS04_geneDACA009511 [Acorus gramineus]